MGELTINVESVTGMHSQIICFNVVKINARLSTLTSFLEQLIDPLARLCSYIYTVVRIQSKRD